MIGVWACECMTAANLSLGDKEPLVLLPSSHSNPFSCLCLFVSILRTLCVMRIARVTFWANLVVSQVISKWNSFERNNIYVQSKHRDTKLVTRASLVVPGNQVATCCLFYIGSNTDRWLNCGKIINADAIIENKRSEQGVTEWFAECLYVLTGLHIHQIPTWLSICWRFGTYVLYENVFMLHEKKEFKEYLLEKLC